MRSLLCLFAFCSVVSAQEPGLKKGDKIIFLGDSITQGGNGPKGYVGLIREKYKADGIEVVNAGVSGNKVPNLLARLEKDVLAKKPQLVVIYIGINDVWHGLSDPAKGTPIEKYESGLVEIIGKIQDAGGKVALCTPTMIGEKKINPADAKLDLYSEAVRKLAKEKKLPLIDLRKAFVDHDAKANTADAEKGILTSDRVHLNEAGNKLVADTILAVIAK